MLTSAPSQYETKLFCVEPAALPLQQATPEQATTKNPNFIEINGFDRKGSIKGLEQTEIRNFFLFFSEWYPDNYHVSIIVKNRK